MKSINWKAVLGCFLQGLVIVGICLIIIGLPVEAQADEDDIKIQVMTQNLYIGANIFKLLDAGAPAQVPFVAAEVFGDIQSTDFYQRAESIADIIAKRRPHLIGLQEVTLLRTRCPADFLPAPNATDELFDYLDILLDALDARGISYEEVANVQNVDAELPVFNGGGLLPDCPYPFFDARVTDHDVTLKRSDVTAYEVFQRNYEAPCRSRSAMAPQKSCLPGVSRPWTAKSTDRRLGSSILISNPAEIRSAISSSSHRLSN